MSEPPDVDVYAEAVQAILRRMRRADCDEGRLARYRAEQLLALAGRRAGRDAIARAAAQRFSRMRSERRDALTLFTVEYQAGGGGAATERHLDPSTIPPRRAERKETEMSPAMLTDEQKERVREACREALQADPAAKPGPVVDALLKAGIDISYGNFTTTYWYPVRKELGISSTRKRKAGAKRTAAKNGAAPGKRNGARPDRVTASEAAVESAPGIEEPPKPEPAGITEPVAPAEGKAEPAIDRPTPASAAAVAPEWMIEDLPGGMTRVRIDKTLPSPMAYRVVSAALAELGKEVA